ncbi:hypothetical protein PVA44_06470 [Entomospira nematocerorum]|nr:hypothetical protein [Entomospira nematocera]WDI33861.1 hypothetical protein PVA44_06470 [Entomospira nematocera]
MQKNYISLSTHVNPWQSLKPASLIHAFLHMRGNGSVQIGDIIESHPFLYIQHDLSRFSRFAFWSESLILSMNSGNDIHAFLLIYSFIQWLNIESIPPTHLDSLFLYYFLLINGSLPENLRTLPSMAYLKSISIHELQQYLCTIADDNSLYRHLLQLYQAYMPVIPKSFQQVKAYDVFI